MTHIISPAWTALRVGVICGLGLVAVQLPPASADPITLHYRVDGQRYDFASDTLTAASAGVSVTFDTNTTSYFSHDSSILRAEEVAFGAPTFDVSLPWLSLPDPPDPPIGTNSVLTHAWKPPASSTQALLFANTTSVIGGGAGFHDSHISFEYVAVNVFPTPQSVPTATLDDFLFILMNKPLSFSYQNIASNGERYLPGSAAFDGTAVFINRSSPIPEPGSLLLFGSGLAVVGVRRWLHRRRVQS
jgi:hypothetical protein